MYFLAALVMTAAAACGRGASVVRPPVSPGYVLFTPLLSGTTYLVDRSGAVVHRWESDFAAGLTVFLLDDGHLLRACRRDGPADFLAGGDGGRIQEFDWDGRLVWEWVAREKDPLPHHDIAPLPSGNVLVIAWEKKSREEAIRAGRDPDRVDPGGLRPDGLYEIQPVRPRGGRVVWEWHAWDHLIQDRDRRRDNHGDVSAHPELINVNAGRREGFTDEAVRRLRALGYLGGGGRKDDALADFMHTNSVAYEPRLDEIALCVWGYDEIWIIDHATTTQEAASHEGGRRGKGGDLLYRWGNPRGYRRGSAAERRLFGPHDARFVPEGRPGAGNLTIFDNGQGRPGRDDSSVLEIRPPRDASGCYVIAAGRPFGPESPVGAYSAKDGSFRAAYLSGAERLADGHTLVTDGPAGRVFEVTAAGEVVWEFVNSHSGHAPNPHGDPPRSIFRAAFIASDHPALSGRVLEPLPRGVERDRGDDRSPAQGARN